MLSLYLSMKELLFGQPHALHHISSTPISSCLKSPGSSGGLYHPPHISKSQSSDRTLSLVLKSESTASAATTSLHVGKGSARLEDQLFHIESAHEPRIHQTTQAAQTIISRRTPEKFELLLSILTPQARDNVELIWYSWPVQLEFSAGAQNRRLIQDYPWINKPIVERIRGQGTKMAREYVVSSTWTINSHQKNQPNPEGKKRKLAPKKYDLLILRGPRKLDERAHPERMGTKRDIWLGRRNNLTTQVSSSNFDKAGSTGKSHAITHRKLLELLIGVNQLQHRNSVIELISPDQHQRGMFHQSCRQGSWMEKLSWTRQEPT
ncbi:uncharacterized protein EAE98_010856 [Botrytis deweyae]|uniref:Uncharacterized protein n=1 Tax=Botrytis deweyae TaxID=2478750 RepID=A0ABQ7I7E2_9HELO|nr:uncharacterized protein EAE98_010856 [Botrytis deweyae]KAF7916001.1 hypothetical protein EAE98_010856 [Botrytis deweyae]